MNSKNIWVYKADGNEVPFDQYKVRRTCIRAGASRKMAKKISEKIRLKVKNGMHTYDIYKMVLDLLKEEDKTNLIGRKYRLKESIMKLGPSGYSFETYVGQILKSYGHDLISTRSIEQGRCVKHEIDVITKSTENGQKFMIECKYHNISGVYTGLKESLYTHARFLDLQEKFDKEMLVCNTKLSDEARIYAKCVGQKIISWRFPEDFSLETMIEQKGLYPITILGLNKMELLAFARNNIVIAKDILAYDPELLSKKTAIASQRIERLQNLVLQLTK